MLLPFLQRVIDLSDANKMTVSNIGVVFGPTLLPQRTSGLDVMGCASLFTQFPQCFLCHSSFRCDRSLKCPPFDPLLALFNRHGHITCLTHRSLKCPPFYPLLALFNRHGHITCLTHSLYQMLLVARCTIIITFSFLHMYPPSSCHQSHSLHHSNPPSYTLAHSHSSLL
jgi:hypothetical protein